MQTDTRTAASAEVILHKGHKVVIGDGAEWIWNLADPYFPGAVQIVDLYHARQHLWELARIPVVLMGMKALFDLFTKSLRDSHRANIVRGNQTDNVIAIQFFESVFKRAPRPFNCKAFAPTVSPERPT